MTDTAYQYWQRPAQPDTSGIATASTGLDDDRAYPYIGIGGAGILIAGFVYAFLASMGWRLPEARS
jgi:hypothetical protein